MISLVTGFVLMLLGLFDGTDEPRLARQRRAPPFSCSRPVWVSSIAAWMLMAERPLDTPWQKLGGSYRKASACGQRRGATRSTRLAGPAQTHQRPIEPMLIPRSCRRGGSCCRSAAGRPPPHLHRRHIRPDGNPGHPREIVVPVQRQRSTSRVRYCSTTAPSFEPMFQLERR